MVGVFKGCGVGQGAKNVKNGEIYKCEAAFMILEGFRGCCKVGVWCFRRSKSLIRDL